MGDMTDGNRVSSNHAARPDAPNVRAVEEAFRVLHEHLRAVQQEADSLSRAREAAVEEGLAALGSEALWLDDESDVRIEWHPAESSDFETRLKSEITDVEDAVRAFLDGGDLPVGLPSTTRRMDANTGEIWEWDVEESLRQIQSDFVRLARERTEHFLSLRSKLDDSWHSAVDVLRTWVREPTRTALEDWGRIQLAWRTALGLPGNRAAEILGVSAPAITRYEKGSRSPSLAYIESMVERMISHGAEPSPEASAVFGVADMFEVSTAEILGTLEVNVDVEHAIRQDITSLLDSLSLEDVKLLLAVARSREAMAALRTLSADDRLAPLRQALNGVSRLEPQQ